jgi:hypothetical protein
MTNEGRVTHYDDGVFTIGYGGPDDGEGTIFHRPRSTVEHDMLLEAMHKKRTVLFETDRTGTASGFRLAS